jgi:FHS family L-fucose permease-like MFS transporter
MNQNMSEKPRLLPSGIVLPFILLASCFMWWGIANNITDPLVRVFKAVFGELSTFQASLIQFGHSRWNHRPSVFV